MKSRRRIAGLAGATMLLANACQVPVGNPLNIPLVKSCTIYIGEAPKGDIKINLSPGTLAIGCNVGL